jgi:hypothetical protein
MVNPIKKPVGVGGKNDDPDVLIIQTLLFAFYTPPETGDPTVSVTGSMDQQTQDAIYHFQNLLLSNPDGRIDPNGTTWKRLLEGVTLNLIPLPRTGTGYYCYSSGDRQWGTLRTIWALEAVCAEFARQKPGLSVGIGDISFRLGTYMSPHDSHRKGKNVDIRPLRTDSADSPVTIDDDEYDRTATSLLADLLNADDNVRSILFNDNKVKNVTSYKGHHNHLHVSMKE